MQLTQALSPRHKRDHSRTREARLEQQQIPKKASPENHHRSFDRFQEQDAENSAKIAPDENENKPAVNMLQASQKTNIKQSQTASSGKKASPQYSSNSESSRPFATRSNKVSMTKNLALATRINKDSRASAPRSSVFRKKSTSDSDTVASATSARSAATMRSTATTNSQATTTSKNSTAAISDHDKAALRKLLATEKAIATKPTSTSSSRDKPTKSEKDPAATSKNVPRIEQTFDQKEYLRGLISMKVAQQAGSSSQKPAGSNAKKPNLPSVQEATETTRARKGKQPSDAKDSAVVTGTKSSSTSSSSASAEQKAILRKVLAKTMNKRSSEDKGANKLSPKNKSSTLENAAVSLSRKVLSDQAKPLTPKKSHKGLNFKGYVRSKMGLSRKPSHLKAKSSDPTRTVEPEITNSTSADSEDSSAIASRTISQAASLSSEMSEGDKTKTTQASSSNESGQTKETYQSSLKGLLTAETIDTDESSTIMGNLQISASTDSMQYSSEEGSADNPFHAGAFQAMDNLARTTPAQMPAGPPKQINKPMNMVPEDSKELSSTPKTTCVAAPQRTPSISYTKFVRALQSEASGSHSQVS